MKKLMLGLFILMATIGLSYGHSSVTFSSVVDTINNCVKMDPYAKLAEVDGIGQETYCAVVGYYNSATDEYGDPDEQNVFKDIIAHKVYDMLSDDGSFNNAATKLHNLKLHLDKTNRGNSYSNFACELAAGSVLTTFTDDIYSKDPDLANKWIAEACNKGINYKDLKAKE